MRTGKGAILRVWWRGGPATKVREAQAAEFMAKFLRTPSSYRFFKTNSFIFTNCLRTLGNCVSANFRSSHWKLQITNILVDRKNPWKRESSVTRIGFDTSEKGPLKVCEK